MYGVDCAKRVDYDNPEAAAPHYKLNGKAIKVEDILCSLELTCEGQLGQNEQIKIFWVSST